jgi:hypothetical protein
MENCMRKSGVYAAAAAMIGGAVVLFAPAPAAATVVSGAAAAATVETAAVAEEVRHRRDHRSSRHRSWRYDRHRHGHRYSHRRPGFTYYYGGYYYANPWWVGPSVGFGVTVPVYPAPSVNMSAHVQWCMNRYRSYDPHTDTYVPRIGVRARCNSPYR